MVKSDVFSLTNGNLRPLFLAFSCHVGDLEEPAKRSLAQELVTSDEGGAIASISGTTFTSGIANSALNYAFYGQLFTSRDSTGTRPLGVALQLAKIADLTRSYWRNNAMYILLGDPAFTLALPAYTVEHEIAAIDTLYTGIRYRVDGSVKAGGGGNGRGRHPGGGGAGRQIRHPRRQAAPGKIYSARKRDISGNG
jgi:hypothetical protein